MSVTLFVITLEMTHLIQQSYAGILVKLNLSLLTLCVFVGR